MAKLKGKADPKGNPFAKGGKTNPFAKGKPNPFDKDAKDNPFANRAHHKKPSKADLAKARREAILKKFSKGGEDNGPSGKQFAFQKGK